MEKKGVFMVFKGGYIGTGNDDFEINNEQEPLLPPETEKAIREKKEQTEDKTVEPPLLPPNINFERK